MAKNFYKNQLGFLMASSVNWIAALLFYLLFIASLVFFVVAPAVSKGSWQYALLAGTLFGVVTYATHDLTNLATIKNWPVVVTVVDMIWGAAIAAAVAIITYFVAVKLGL